MLNFRIKGRGDGSSSDSSVVSYIITAYCLLMAIALVVLVYNQLFHKNKKNAPPAEKAITDSFTSYLKEKSVPPRMFLFRLTENEIETQEYFVKMKNNQLASSVMEIRCPVDYDYSINTTGTWHLTLEDGILKVEAPPLEADTPKMEPGKLKSKIYGNYSVLNEIGKIDEFKKKFKNILEEKASSQEYLSKVKENARIGLSNFIVLWLLTKSGKECDARHILVRFENEQNYPKLAYSVR